MRIASLLALSALLASCGNTGKKTDQTAKLSLASLYNADSVKWVAANSPEKNNAAEKEFLKAIDEFRNKKNAAGSIDKFTKSILLQPQAKTYYELGNALMETHQLADAIQAFNMAELLDYKPISKLLYNKACAYSLSKKTDSCRYYLIAAIEFGYNNMNNAMKDPDLKYFREEDYSAQSQILTAFSGSGEPGKLEWNLFAKQFKQLPIPLTIDKAYAKELGKNFISYDFELYVAEMRDSKFSRDVGSSFFYVGTVKKMDAFKTLIYAVNDEISEEGSTEDADHAYYFMASYDNSGKLIDKLLVAGQPNFDEPYRVVTIASNTDFELTDYKVEYEKDPAKEGFINNPEKSRTEIKKASYYITEDGHFAPKTQQLALSR